MAGRCQIPTRDETETANQPPDPLVACPWTISELGDVAALPHASIRNHRGQSWTPNCHHGSELGNLHSARILSRPIAFTAFMIAIAVVVALSFWPRNLENARRLWMVRKPAASRFHYGHPLSGVREDPWTRQTVEIAVVRHKVGCPAMQLAGRASRPFDVTTRNRVDTVHPCRRIRLTCLTGSRPPRAELAALPEPEVLSFPACFLTARSIA